MSNSSTPEPTAAPDADRRALSEAWERDRRFFLDHPDTEEYRRGPMAGEFGPLAPPPGEPTLVRRSASGAVHGRRCGPVFAMAVAGETVVGVVGPS